MAFVTDAEEEQSDKDKQEILQSPPEHAAREEWVIECQEELLETE